MFEFKTVAKCFYKNLSTRRFYIQFLIFIVVVGIIGCSEQGKNDLPPASPNNGGLILPGGFSAVVVADSIGRARHLTVRDNGDIYVKLSYNDAMNGRGGTVGLRDTNNDGKADSIRYFGDYRDEGSLACCITIHKGYLYTSSLRKVLKTKLTPGELVPKNKTVTVLTDTAKNLVQHWHTTKPVAFDDKGYMYVPFGAPNDACQPLKYGNAGKPEGQGLDPCPLRKTFAGIWRFDATKTGLTQGDGHKFATGIRSVVGMRWNSQNESLYAMMHGIDNFHTTYPDLYTAWQAAVLPAARLSKITDGSDFGWPYAYYDQMKKKNMLQPGYGGDGEKVGRASTFDKPVMGFPGHWAPEDLLFYRGNQFPNHYKNGVFLAFHGSTDRSPYPQAGFIVVFVPFKHGKPSGKREIFADGFAQVDTVVNTSDAAYRPMGLAEGPDGSLYISESNQGKIWRVMYKADKDEFGAGQLAQMKKKTQSKSYIKTPDKQKDKLSTASTLEGSILYKSYCASCHASNGKGDNRFPPLAGSRFVNGDNKRLINIILNGRQGGITVKGQTYNGLMPSFKHSLDDHAVASIITYIRKRFNNSDHHVRPEEVRNVRNNLNK